MESEYQLGIMIHIKQITLCKNHLIITIVNR
jgi:hypothetical protein